MLIPHLWDTLMPPVPGGIHLPVCVPSSFSRMRDSNGWEFRWPFRTSFQFRSRSYFVARGVRNALPTSLHGKIACEVIGIPFVRGMESYNPQQIMGMLYTKIRSFSKC